VRAYAISGDDIFAAAFHDRLRVWLDANPPFRGVQWACGQETAIRALAVLHAEDSLPALHGDEHAAALRIFALLASSGERIADAIGYGLSQRNNHGISEAAGLVHIGLRLGAAHPEASRWVRIGIRLLDEQIGDQFGADGWYAQHSFTYMRVALEQALHAQRTLEVHGLSLCAASLTAIDRAITLLLSIVNDDSGVAPNHGANDGGRAAPLSTAPYRDFRPLLTLAALVRKRALPRSLDPDAEVVTWLGVQPPPAGPARADGVESGSSGWAVARVAGNAVFVRAGRYTHRPSHLDQLHIDVRLNGHEVVTDPGTFAYNASPPWKNGLATARVHNGPVLDGREPAERGPGFLWRSWPEARLLGCEYKNGTARLVAEVPGRVRRQIDVSSSAVVIVDCVLDSSVQTMQVLWLLHPETRGHVVHAFGAETVVAREGDVTAWFSPTYGMRVASTAIRLRRQVRTDGPTAQTIIRLAANEGWAS